MADKNNPNVFGGFEALAGGILGTPDGGIPEMDSEAILKDLEDKAKAKAKEEGEAEKEEGEKEENESTEEETEDETKEEEELTEDEKKELGQSTEDEEEETEEGETEDLDLAQGLGEYEQPLTKAFQEALFEELGWEVEKDEDFDTVKELVDYMNQVVSESSQPQYANEELQKLDAFVKQGGKLEDYFQNTAGGTMDLEDPDLTNENVQKDIIREYLSTVRGYKEDRIKRKIARDEDGGILEEEAEDALELLKEYKEDQQQKLLEAQEKYAEDVQNQQQKLISDVEKELKTLKDIRGIKITERDKAELLDYIFKPTSDGRTTYQKRYAEDLVMNLIESAFFSKDKDKNTLIAKAKQSAKSDAYKEIHQKIKASKGKRQKSTEGQEGGSGSDTSILGNLGHSLIRKI